MFAASSAVSKWLVASYPIGEVLFTRTSVALLTCALFILSHTGLAVFRTQRLRHHVASQRAKPTASLSSSALKPWTTYVNGSMTAMAFSQPGNAVCQ